MNNLFHNTHKTIHFHQNKSHQIQIKKVLNPYNQQFIDEHHARQLGIISHDYYTNRYGGLIPLHIAASKGWVQLINNYHIQIEYRSKQYPFITNLIIYEVYDNIHQCLISCEEAIDNGYLNLELFSYLNGNLSMTIHEAFYRGLILGELQTNLKQESKTMIYMNEKQDNDEYENMFSSLTNIINSLSEFRNTINISDECELTSDGFIRERKTGKCYLLTQAIEDGFVSMKEISIKNKMDKSKNESTLLNDTISSTMNFTRDDHEITRYFSDTFILDLLKATGSATDEHEKSDRHLFKIEQLLSSINTC